MNLRWIDGLRFGTAAPTRRLKGLPELRDLRPGRYDADAAELAAERRAAGAEWWGEDGDTEWGDDIHV